MSNVTPYTVKVVDGDGNDQDFPAPPPLLQTADVNLSASGDTVIFGASAGLLTRIYRVLLVADGPTLITFFDGAAALAGTIKISSAGEVIILDPGIFPYWQGSVNTAFKLNSSNAVQLTGGIWGFKNAT